MDILELWKAAFKEGERTVVHEPNNGLKNWIAFCKKYNLGKHDLPTLKWNIIQPGIESKKSNTGHSHFIYQVYRIPMECVANPCRVFQVAYNLGQMKGLGDVRYPTELKSYISK